MDKTNKDIMLLGIFFVVAFLGYIFITAPSGDRTGFAGGVSLILIGVFGNLLMLMLLGFPPGNKSEAETRMYVGLGIFIIIFLSLKMLSSDPKAFQEFMEESIFRWLVLLAFLLSSILMTVSYRHIKRFEQEEMLEKLAEKMGEKLGESMAKELKAKDS